MNSIKLNQNRKIVLVKLKDLKSFAYHSLTCREYEFICSLIHYIELLISVDEMKNNKCEEAYTDGKEETKQE